MKLVGQAQSDFARVQRYIGDFKPATVHEASAALQLASEQLQVEHVDTGKNDPFVAFCKQANDEVWAGAAACLPSLETLTIGELSRRLSAVSCSNVGDYSRKQVADGFAALAGHYAMRWTLSHNLRPDGNEFDALSLNTLWTQHRPSPAGPIDPKLAHALERSLVRSCGTHQFRDEVFCPAVEGEIERLTGQKVTVTVAPVLDGDLSPVGEYIVRVDPRQGT